MSSTALLSKPSEDSMASTAVDSEYSPPADLLPLPTDDDKRASFTERASDLTLLTDPRSSELVYPAPPLSPDKASHHSSFSSSTDERAAPEKEEEERTVFQLDIIKEDEEEDVAGQSDAYKPFFKMLRMGVPKDAVKAKMTAKGLVSDVLDLGPDTLMSAVQAMERQFEENKRKVIVPAKKKAPKLQMDVIPGALLNKGRSVWSNSGQDVKLSQDATAKLEALFLVEKPVVPAKSLVGGGKKRAPVSVLEPKRVQGIAIAMKKLKLNPARFLWALREMNESVLTPGVVEIALKVKLWPSDDELALLVRKHDAGQELMEVDALLHLVGTSLPDAMSRINALSFKFQYTTSLTETLEAGATIKRCSVAVLNNAKLHKVLRCILQIANRMNEESGVVVSGITLTSLLRLSATKSQVDKSLSLMEFIVQTLANSDEPACLEFVDELTFLVNDARKIDLAVHVKAVREYRRGVEAVRRIKQMEAFAYKAMNELDELESSMQVSRDFYHNALEYFGYEKEPAMLSNEFFESLYAFMTMVSNAHAKHKTQVENMTRKQRAELVAAQRAARPPRERPEAPPPTRRKSALRRGSMLGKFRRTTFYSSKPRTPQVPAKTLLQREDSATFADDNPGTALQGFLKTLRGSGDSIRKSYDGLLQVVDGAARRSGSPNASGMRESQNDADTGAPPRKTFVGRILGLAVSRPAATAPLPLQHE